MKAYKKYLNFYYKSPIGILELQVINDSLTSLKLTSKMASDTLKTEFVQKLFQQLDEYFLGKRQNFDIAFSYSGTDFQKRVWQELTKIPYGKTTSYSEIASRLGNQNAQRAVGNACNKNPIMIIIPCHRVVSKTGNIGGFAYGGEVKEKLLDLEKYINK